MAAAAKSVDRIVPSFRFTFELRLRLRLEICGKKDAAACNDVYVYLEDG